MSLRIVPVTFRTACQFVEAHHRHHAPPTGHVFSLGVALSEALVGVAMVGRPVARVLDDGHTLEVNRTATDGTPNANSMLYGAAWRAAKALGWDRLITYTQAGESGSSLRAAGWRVVAERPPRAGWNVPSRPRGDRGADRVARDTVGGRLMATPEPGAHIPRKGAHPAGDVDALVAAVRRVRSERLRALNAQDGPDVDLLAVLDEGDCPRCNGDGVLPSGDECHACGGYGIAAVPNPCCNATEGSHHAEMAALRARVAELEAAQRRAVDERDDLLLLAACPACKRPAGQPCAEPDGCELGPHKQRGEALAAAFTQPVVAWRHACGRFTTSVLATGYRNCLACGSVGVGDTGWTPLVADPRTVPDG